MLWFLVLRSGVHSTIAGVALAATIPVRPTPGRLDDPASPLHQLEHALQPWVAFLILSIVSFANAGLSLAGVNAATLQQPVPLGVALLCGIGFEMSLFVRLLAFAVQPELQDATKIGVLVAR